MDIAKIAVLGPKGTFSDMAYLQYKRQYEEETGKVLEAEYYPTIDDVFSAVYDDACCELGIVPIENTLDGYVQRTLDLLLEKDVRIIDENTVKVQFSLVANAGDVADIDNLYVQFKANGQCRQFIKSLSGVNIVTTESNMESYYKLEDIKGRAAIVPAHIAEAENSGRLVVDGVTDAENNHTRFVIFKRSSSIALGEVKGTKNKVRMPVYIIPKTDRPGLLYEILKEFYDKQINLISIMSRPTKQELGTYNFYIEIDCLASQIGVVREALANIQRYNDIKILGAFEE